MNANTQPENYFEAQIRSAAGRGFISLQRFDSDVDPDAEYRAHKLVADYLERTMPGQWRFSGDIEARNFDGQFQEIDGLPGDLVLGIVREHNPAKDAERARLHAEKEAADKRDRSVENALEAAIEAIEQNMPLHHAIAMFDGDGGFMFGFHQLEKPELVQAWDNIEKNLSRRFTFFEDASGAAWGMFMRTLQYRLRENMAALPTAN